MKKETEKKMEKFKIYARFANDMAYYSRININVESLKDPHIIAEEVFCTVDGVRIAIKRKDWDDLNNHILEEYELNN